MALRIVVATRLYPPEPAAAAYRLAAIVRALETKGHRPTVYTTWYRTARTSGQSIRRWPVLRDKSGSVRGYLQYASFDIPLFFRLLFSRPFDLILVEPPPTSGVVVRLAAALRRRPYVYFAGDVSSLAAEGIGTPRAVVHALRGVERWVMAGATRILTVSPGVTNAVKDLVHQGARISEVGTGVDTEQFCFRGPVAASPEPFFVYAGTMSEIQGAGVFVDGFCRVAREHPEVRLLMFGQGTEYEDLIERASEFADRVEFRGLVSGDAVAQAFRGSIAVLASVRPGRGYDFAYATKALAGLSCGAPVIYAGVGPIGEAVARENLGRWVNWDAEDVADAMRAILQMPYPKSDRKRISSWVTSHHSLTSVGASAVEVLEDAALRR